MYFLFALALSTTLVYTKHYWVSKQEHSLTQAPMILKWHKIVRWKRCGRLGRRLPLPQSTAPFPSHQFCVAFSITKAWNRLTGTWNNNHSEIKMGAPMIAVEIFSWHVLIQLGNLFKNVTIIVIHAIVWWQMIVLLLLPFHSWAQNSNSPNRFGRKCISDAVRINSSINFHIDQAIKSQVLRTVWYISGEKWTEKIEVDHSGVKGLKRKLLLSVIDYLFLTLGATTSFLNLSDHKLSWELISL